MEYKTNLIRLPTWATTEIEKYAQEKGLAFATAVRCLVVERLKEGGPTKIPSCPRYSPGQGAYAHGLIGKTRERKSVSSWKR